jgi:hypothetical protein
VGLSHIFASNQAIAPAVYRRCHVRSSKNSRPAGNAIICFTTSSLALEYSPLVGCEHLPYRATPMAILMYHAQNLPSTALHRSSLKFCRPRVKGCNVLACPYWRYPTALAGEHRLACGVSGRCLATSSGRDGAQPTMHVNWLPPDVWGAGNRGMACRERWCGMKGEDDEARGAA